MPHVTYMMRDSFPAGGGAARDAHDAGQCREMQFLLPAAMPHVTQGGVVGIPAGYSGEAPISQNVV